MKQDNRFVCIFRQMNTHAISVLIDTKTGVNYLYVREGFGGGLTPLLDAEGKVVVSKEYVK